MGGVVGAGDRAAGAVIAERSYRRAGARDELYTGLESCTRSRRARW